MKMLEKFKAKHPKLATFLETKAPSVLKTILDTADDFFPPLKLITAMVGNDPSVKPEDKLEFAKLELEFKKEEEESYREEQKNVTERHKNDMLSDSWMSKNIRPYTLVFLLILLTTIIIWDSCSSDFIVESMYVELLKYLLISVFLFYFGGREMTKMLSAYKKK